MPGVSRVVPEEDLLKCGNQASHVLKLASKQPQDGWLAGRSDCKRLQVLSSSFSLCLKSSLKAELITGLKARFRQCDRRASARSVCTWPLLRDCE